MPRPHRNPLHGAITITFNAYQHGGGHVTDQVAVKPNDPLEAQRIAYKYARKDNEHAQFYNKTLLLVSVAQCVRAVIDDGTNTVLMNCSYEPVIGSCSDTRQSGCCSRDGESGCRRRTITDADVEMS